MPHAKEQTKLDRHAQAILDARGNCPNATPVELYDLDTMPAELRKVNIANDKAVDTLYRKGGFASEGERVEHFFIFYEKMTAGILASKAKPKKATHESSALTRARWRDPSMQNSRKVR